jgi:hypothetical protein
MSTDPAFIYMHEPLIEASFRLATAYIAWANVPMEHALAADASNGSDVAREIHKKQENLRMSAIAYERALAEANARTSVYYVPTNDGYTSP